MPVFFKIEEENMLQQLMNKENKKENLRKRLIRYYETVNKDRVSIPAFLLADEDIRLIEQKGTLNFWYKNFKNGL